METRVGAGAGLLSCSQLWGEDSSDGEEGEDCEDSEGGGGGGEEGDGGERDERPHTGGERCGVAFMGASTGLSRRSGVHWLNFRNGVFLDEVGSGFSEDPSDFTKQTN